MFEGQQHSFSPLFSLPAGWDVDVMTGAGEATLDHKVEGIAKDGEP